MNTKIWSQNLKDVKNCWLKNIHTEIMLLQDNRIGLFAHFLSTEELIILNFGKFPAWNLQSGGVVDN